MSRIAVLAAVAVLVVWIGQAAEKEIVLATDGATEYSVVVRTDPPRGEAFVVEDFLSLMKQATGVAFPVVDAAKVVRGRRICIGFAPDGAGDEKLGEQEWRVVTTADGDLHLYGGGDNGARLAVYDFLQNVLGFRFFDMHGGVKVPDLRTCRVQPQNRRRKPSFRFRYLNGESGMFNRPESSLFLFRNGQNSWSGRDLAKDGIEVPHDEFDFMPPHAHSLRYYLPGDSKEPTFPWIKKLGGPDLKAAHPEYFTLDAKGKRVFNHQYCLSNPDLRALLSDRILENMRRNPERTVFDVSAGDTPGVFCNCEGCKALTAKYGTPAGPLVDFVLEFCPRAEKEHPGKIVMCLAYRKKQTQPPPKGIDRMPANFMPDFAPIDDNFAKDWTDPANAQTYDDLKGWGRLCRNVMVWYYTNPYTGALTPPLGNVERGVADIRQMAEAGVTAHIWEHNVGVAWGLGFTELQSYVYANLMMDVSKDWRALADEFIDFEYGAAADGFRRYWRELEDLRKTKPLHLAWDARESTYRHLTPERMIRWDADFDAMERAVANDPDRLFAIRRVRANLDHAMLNRYRDVKKAGTRHSAAKLAERVMDTAKRVADAFCAKRLEGRKRAFLKSVGDSVATAKILYSGESKPLPQELFGGIPENRLFVSIPKVNGASYESDPDAAFGCRAVYTNNKKGAKLPLRAAFEDVIGKRYNSNIARVTRENLPPNGKYKFYAMGCGVLSLDSVFRIGVDDWWDFKTPLGNAYEFGSYNRAKFYASLKFEGPEFYPEDAGKPNRVFCDRVVVVRE